jgi:HIRAN domain
MLRREFLTLIGKLVGAISVPAALPQLQSQPFGSTSRLTAEQPATLYSFFSSADETATQYEPIVQQPTLLQSSPLAGFQYHQGEKIWDQLSLGAPLKLVREPHNAYDNLAIRIEWRGQMLGYLPRTENHAAARLLDQGKDLQATIVNLAASDDPWKRVLMDINIIT